MNKISREQENIINEFDLFDDWTQKYEHLINIGKEMPKLEEKYKVDENLIKGCQSKVWLSVKYDNGRLYFFGDSDAIITKGIVGLLIRAFSNNTAEDISRCDLGFIDKIGLKDQLSPTRANGLSSMIKQMKIYALIYLKK